MATRKRCTALVVDVSPSMHPHLGPVGDHLSRVVQNRILNARIDEFALIAFGSDETNNDVHTEGLDAAARSSAGSCSSPTFERRAKSTMTSSGT